MRYSRNSASTPDNSRVYFIAKTSVVLLKMTIGIERNIINYSQRTFGLQLSISILKKIYLFTFNLQYDCVYLSFLLLNIALKAQLLRIVQGPRF